MIDNSAEIVEAFSRFIELAKVRRRDLFNRWAIEVQIIDGIPYFGCTEHLEGGYSYGHYETLKEAVDAAWNISPKENGL